MDRAIPLRICEEEVLDKDMINKSYNQEVLKNIKLNQEEGLQC